MTIQITPKTTVENDHKFYTNRCLMYFGVLVITLSLFFVNPVKSQDTNRKDLKSDYSQPIVTGYGKGLFEIGDLMYREDFKNPDDWMIQIEETDVQTEPRIDFWNGFLEVVVPGRGATIWNRNKFSGNVAITYKVKAPSTYVEQLGVVVRDINTFWHASDPDVPADIFNHDKYTGSFSSYHKQQGYYASMGGRDNTTTRFRRYPRIRDGEPVEHISLSERDGREKFLIRPDHMHTIQLVTYDDVIQYIVDGKVFYEIQEGDTVTVSRPDGAREEVVYTSERFSSYNEGWFGFRLVNTHHIYSDFRVYRLESAE